MITTVVTCPQCDYDGQESTLAAKSIPLIPQYTKGHYDNLGGYHVHNPDNTQVELECSRGHRFINVITNKCWCGWINQK